MNNLFSTYKEYINWFFLITSLLVLSFISPIGTDEAMILNWANSYTETNKFFTNVNILSELPFFKSWVYIQSIIYDKYSFYALNRLISVFCSLLVFYICYKTIKELFNSITLAYISLIFIFMWFLTSDIGINIRPEVFYMLTITLSIYSVVQFIKNDNIVYVYISLLANSVAFAIHPNGVIGFIILVMGLYFTFKSLNLKRIVSLILLVILSFFIFAYNLLWEQSINDFIVAFNNFSGDSSHQMSWKHEYIRYVNLVFNSPLFIPFLIISYFGILSQWINFKKLEKIEKFIFVVNLSLIFYLIVLPIKWDYYFSIIIPSLSFSFIYFINRYINNIQYLYNALKIFLITMFFAFFINNFKSNELFLDFLGVNSQRVVILKDIKNKLLNKVVYAPVVFSQLLNSKEHNVKYLDDGKYEYIIIPYDRKVDIKKHLLLQTFNYQNQIYILFKVVN